MNSYKTVDDLYYNMLTALVTRGYRGNSRNGKVAEMWGVSLGLTDPDKNFVLHPHRALSPVYASAELLWYLSGSHTIEMISHYAPSYAQYAEDDGNDWAAYGHRIETNVKVVGEDKVPFTVNQLEIVIEMLKQDPNSRQAVITLWAPHDLFNAAQKLTKSVPCTLTWQFLIRDDKLQMITNMRSNDAWLGLPYDVYAFTTLQRMVADELGVPMGMYAHFVGSMHLYEKDAKKAADLLHAGAYGYSKIARVNGSGPPGAPERLPAMGHEYPIGEGFYGLPAILDYEMQSRIDSVVPDGVNIQNASDILKDAAHICAFNNTPHKNFTEIRSPLLCKAFENYCDRQEAKFNK